MATIKEIFDLYIFLETKFKSIRWAKNSFQVQRNNEVSLQHRETKTTEQANFFFSLWYSVSMLKCLWFAFRFNFFLLTITPSLCKNLTAHLRDCRLNSGSASVSWRCFSCFYLAMKMICRVATAVALPWVMGDKDVNPLFPVSALFHLFLKLMSTYCCLLQPALQVLLGKLIHIPQTQASDKNNRKTPQTQG